ncbi:MAG TPA: potassium channel protein [Blastocatellia bacterium]|nr:potassium channel protein [Blastocatellia bacterium]
MPSHVRIYYSLAAIVLLVLAGTLGYHLIEGWPFFDGLYMTIITLTTIGYGETHPLTQAGRFFTLGLIIVGVTTFGFLISQLTQILIETEITSVLGRRRMFKDISKLSGHYILCGAGRVGTQVINELRKKGVDFVVIDRDEHIAERLLSKGDLVLVGDATDETVLEGANVRTARCLITAASSDAENVYVVLTARGLNPNLHIVARATDHTSERQLVRAGANKVVSPTLIGSHRIAQAALSPAVADFIELTTMTETLDLGFEQIRILPGSPLDGRRLKDSGIRTQSNAIIVSITNAEGRMHFNPDGEQELRAGDLLIAIGTQADLVKLAETANYKRGSTMRLPKLPLE